MSYDFNGSSDYLREASAVVSSFPFSMACWFRSADAAAVQYMIGVFASGSDDNYAALIAVGSVAGDPVWAVKRGGGSPTNAVSVAGYSAGTWHHACGVFVSATVHHLFFDGVKSTAPTGANTPSGLNRSSVGVLDRLSITGYFNGLLAECAWWNIDLTDANAGALAKGVAPIKVRPQSLVRYRPLIRDTNDRKSSATMTAGGAPAAAGTHPRIYY